MVIVLENIKNIEEIMSTMQCPKDFECYGSDFKKIGRVKDVGLPSFVQCLEPESARSCGFSVQFGYLTYCKCPLRVYLAKKEKI